MEALPKPVTIDDGDIAAIEEFVEDARRAMKDRMHAGLRRGWGLLFRTNYADGEVIDRLDTAVEHLKIALRAFEVTGDQAEVRKRAADVANQAFMAADHGRLTNNTRF